MAPPLTINEILQSMQLAAMERQEQQNHAAEIRRLAVRICEASDPWEASTEVWVRFHSKLVRSGIWAQLSAPAAKVYVTLTSFADIHTRTTFVGIEKVAEHAGYSVHSVARAYGELKRWGLISRVRRRFGQYQPYFTFLLGPDKWQVPSGGRERVHEAKSP